MAPKSQPLPRNFGVLGNPGRGQQAQSAPVGWPAPPWLAPGLPLRPFCVMASKSHPLVRGTLVPWGPGKGPAGPSLPRGDCPAQGGWSSPSRDGPPPWLAPGLPLRPFCVMASKSHPLVRGTLVPWGPGKGPAGPSLPRGDCPAQGGWSSPGGMGPPISPPGSPLLPLCDGL